MASDLHTGETTRIEPVSAREPEDALMRFGRLYRNADGHEVWGIFDPEGNVYVEDIASDHDARWLAEQMLAR